MPSKAALQRDLESSEERIRQLEARVRQLELGDRPAYTGVIPEGTYKARILEVDRREARAFGRKYWSVRFLILDPSYPGKNVWWNCVDRVETPLERVASDLGVRLRVAMPVVGTIEYDGEPSELEGVECRVVVGVNTMGPFGPRPGQRVNDVREVLAA